MTRATPEWTGRTPDSAIPTRVRARVRVRANDRCEICTRPIATGEAWDVDHKTALVNQRELHEDTQSFTMALRAALRKAEFQSVRGSFKFNHNHFPIQSYYLNQVARDEIETVIRKVEKIETAVEPRTQVIGQLEQQGPIH